MSSSGPQRRPSPRRRLKFWRQSTRSQQFSRHFAPPSRGSTPSFQTPQFRPHKSLRLGLLGLFLLGGTIWGVSELGHLPPLVKAQAPQVEPTDIPKSPWQAASFPVENFVAYTSAFGYRQHPYGGTSFHYGLDIAAPMGSYIRAWWEGIVVEVSDDTACGTSVVVESEGWLHIYCHMQGYIVIEVDGDRWMVDNAGGIQIRQGDKVKSGQRIGRIGMTGRTTGPHLHWGMKYQGSWIDPATILKAMSE